VTYNEDFFDASVRHQVDLLRYGSGVARKVNSLLDATRADLRKQVERRLGKVTGINGSSLRRLRELERAIDQQRSGAWNDVTEEWSRVAVDVALEEPMFVAGALTSILPVELDLVQPSPATLRALATTRPFQGKFLKEWADSTSRADLTRIHQQIRIGMVAGESSRDIAARVFGARGAMNVTRAQVDAVTRTVINHVSNAAQQEFLQANSDLFSVEQLVATLDARTTPVCRAEDGKQYPVGKGPIPPLHVACRSIRVGVIDGEVVGERPFKAGTEKQMLREYAAAQGWAGPPKSRDDLPRGHKKSFDEFSRRRMRELTGQVPARTTYQEWLSRQPAEIQDDILGPTRGKLFREGGLKLDKFVNRDGDELTLDELRARNREAFNRAGMAGDDRAERERAEAARRASEAAKDRRRVEEAEERARRAEKAAREAERKRRAAELEAEKLRRIEDARVAQDRARRDAQAASQKAIADLGQHAHSIAMSGDVDPKYVRIAADTIGKIRPPSTGPLGVLEIHAASGIKVEAYGQTVTAEGIYSPQGAVLQLATQLPAQGAALSDGVFTTADVAKTREEAFARTVTHEYGHHIHMSTGFNSKVDNVVARAYREAAPQARGRSARNELPTAATPPEGAPSRYGTANRYEFWAESFTSYHHDREWLKANKPVAHKMVEEVLGLLK